MAWAEKQFEESMHPHINSIYRRLFSNLTEIKRSDRTKECDQKILFMDKELAIDTFLHFKDGTILTMQEKTRTERILKMFGPDFTFEYYNNPDTKEQGEWFKLAAQMYFYGYARADNAGYIRYWLMNIPKLRIFLKNEIGLSELEKKYLRRNRPPARANFFAIPFAILRSDCIMYDSDSSPRKIKNRAA